MRSTTELRDEILAAARAEFAEFGLAGSRIDRIAKNARASKERMYAHFGDKEALFREVVIADRDDYFAAVDIRPEAIPEFVGDMFDLTQAHPEHLRMLTWARLEGLAPTEPDLDGKAPPRLLAAIEAAQADGRIDSVWAPNDLVVLLFGIAVAWAQFPDSCSPNDAATLAARRSAAVEAARRLVEPPRELNRPQN